MKRFVAFVLVVLTVAALSTTASAKVRGDFTWGNGNVHAWDAHNK